MTQTSQQDAVLPLHEQGEARVSGNLEYKRRDKPARIWMLMTLTAFITGSLAGYFIGTNTHKGMTNQGESNMAALVEQINPPEGYPIDASYGDIGPQLIAAGAFRLDDLVSVYRQASQPLTADQQAILEYGSDDQVVFNQQNAYFLLNLFWALGLTNQNPVLDKGPILRNGRDNVASFASTGGWSLAAKPVDELFSSTPIVSLTGDQQKRLEEVAVAVFRPCCDNPTHFPDCNHGMAMLGLLELMASQDASVDELFRAAKYANAYWYLGQTLELAAYFQAAQQASFDQVDARQLVSQPFSSLSGFRNVHQWLSSNSLLPQAPGSGSNCGV